MPCVPLACTALPRTCRTHIHNQNPPRLLPAQISHSDPPRSHNHPRNTPKCLLFLVDFPSTSITPLCLSNILFLLLLLARHHFQPEQFLTRFNHSRLRRYLSPSKSIYPLQILPTWQIDLHLDLPTSPCLIHLPMGRSLVPQIVETLSVRGSKIACHPSNLAFRSYCSERVSSNHSAETLLDGIVEVW